ncbi:MAG: purine-binding chemotaxis protein CheW [Planctomycetia bacterium]|nr:purine-binding chemotaxis protein CheW [Planctomycetia bacterium]
MTARDLEAPAAPPVAECWRTIGVSGDRTCPELRTYIHCRNCPVLAAAARTFFDRAAPEGYIDSWRQVLEEPGVAADTDAAGVLVFRLGREWLALPTGVLVEVTERRPLHRIPHRKGTILEGIVNIRGQLQLCVSLHGMLGLEPEGPARDTATARLLVVEFAGERWVFGADEVAGVQRVTRSSLRPVPSTVSQSDMRSTVALFDWEERAVGLLDEARLFDGVRRLVSP